MKKKTSKFYIVLLLITVFAAPGITAYLFYTHPSWLGGSRINKGDLLAKPVLLTSVEKTNKWRILYWSATGCKRTCLKELDILARVRLALGRRLYQVDQMLVMGSQALKLSSDLDQKLQINDFKIRKLSVEDTQRLDDIDSKEHVFIMNPDNYLVLSYTAGANPDDVYKDLKLLLNTTESN